MAFDYIDKAKHVINSIKKAHGEAELYKFITESLITDFSFDRVSVRRADWERGILSLVCHLGFTTQMPPFEVPLSEESGAFNFAAANGEPFAVTTNEDLHPSLRIPQEISALNPEMRNSSFAIIPIRTHNAVRSLIYIDKTPSGGNLTKEDIEALGLISEMSSAILENLVSYEQLDTALIKDEMTLLFNRTYFLKRLREEFERSKRFALPLSICMFDIDDFKLVNDSYGHMFGDQVLQKISSAATNIVRNLDVVARYGGEEFAVLFPHTNLDSAIIAVDRIQRSLYDADIRTNGNSISVTATFGISSYPPVKTSQSEQLLHYADMALYEGKRNYDKNCIVIFNGNGFSKIDYATA